MKMWEIRDQDGHKDDYRSGYRGALMRPMRKVMSVAMKMVTLRL